MLLQGFIKSGGEAYRFSCAASSNLSSDKPWNNTGRTSTECSNGPGDLAILRLCRSRIVKRSVSYSIDNVRFMSIGSKGLIKEQGLIAKSEQQHESGLMRTY
eukprot:scaffold292393_cov89-Attheya_sp.AAC.1